MDIDLPTEVGRTEETVEALMEYLVGPLLPLKHNDIAKETPSESQQTMVAKQVHAAAVLYNYYHLNHHREQEFLKFDQFCNLAIMFKPSILQHMKYMRQSDRPDIDDPANQLSLTEKAIMDACTISETLLDASPNVSSMIKEWPITKVAVLLVDSKKENCLLQFNNGVWSLIEKDLYSDNTGITSETKTGKKRKTEGKHDTDKEAGFQQLAISAVKEVTGIADTELMVLEDHVVYSLSRAKTAAYFYIVQSTQSINEDIIVPIQDAICSLQGPVVQNSSGSWVITPVVEYYYVLPYAEIMSEWFSRVSNSLSHEAGDGIEDAAEMFLGSQKSREKEIGETKRVVMTQLTVTQLTESPRDKEIIETKSEFGNGIGVANNENTKQKEVNGSFVVDKPLVCVQNESQNSKMHVPLKVYRHGKRRTANAIIKTDLKNTSSIDECKDERVDEDKTPTVDHALVSFQQNNESLKSFHFTLAAKGSELSEAALRALSKKKEKLRDQQHNIKDELALCDKKIQAIMRGGVGDCLDLKLETVIDCCNEICQQVKDSRDQHDGQGSPLPGKSLSEAQLTLRKACKELDDICMTNNWMLPMYHMSNKDGGFVAHVTVRGTDFECSDASGVQPSIHEARNTAATHMIAKLQKMASEPVSSLP